MSFTTGKASCEEYTPDFEDIIGAWRIGLDRGSNATLFVNPDGTASLTSSNGISYGVMQPVVGPDAKAGWQYRLAFENPSDAQYLFKKEDGNLIVQVGPRTRYSGAGGNSSTPSITASGVAHFQPPQKLQEEPESSLLLLIVGPAAGLCLCSVLAVAAVVFFRKRRSYEKEAKATAVTDPETDVEAQVANLHTIVDQPPCLLGSQGNSTQEKRLDGKQASKSKGSARGERSASTPRGERNTARGERKGDTGKGGEEERDASRRHRKGHKEGEGSKMAGTSQPFKQANNPFAKPSPVADLESGSGLQALSLTEINVDVEAGDAVPELPSGASDDVPDKPSGASDESKDWTEVSEI
jgi:hypothetical protein